MFTNVSIVQYDYFALWRLLFHVTGELEKGLVIAAAVIFGIVVFGAVVAVVVVGAARHIVRQRVRKEDTADPLVREEDTANPLVHEEDTANPLVHEEDTANPLVREEDTANPLVREEDAVIAPEHVEINNVPVQDETIPYYSCPVQERVRGIHPIHTIILPTN